MRFVVAGLIVALAGVSSAQGQGPDAPPLFVDAAAFAAVALRSHGEYRGPVAIDDDLSATVPGGTIAVGTFLARAVSLRVEAAFPWGERTQSGSPVYPVEPFVVSVINDPTFVALVASETTYNSGSASVLVGYHRQVTGRIRVGYLGGAAVVRERYESRFTQSTPGFPPFIPPVTQTYESRSIDYRMAMALGVDVEMTLGSHVSVVPQMRVVAFPGEVGLRPGIGIRWTP